MFPMALLGAALCFIGCSEPKPKTLEELYEEERKLPAVFLTTKSNQQVIAPGDSGVFVDEKSGELCWPAQSCTNPDCPGRAADGTPFLFIAPDKAVIINPDGTVGYDRSQAGEIDNYYGQCPKCLETRNLPSESEADQLRYSQFVQPYVLPKTAQRREELAAARKEREAALKERMQRSAN